MYFLMMCNHKPDMDELRNEHRPAHREHVANGGNGLAKVLVGSGIREETSQSSLGNFGILEADSAENARKFAETDPFNVNGIVDSIEIITLADNFQAHRIDPMTK